MAKAKVYGAVTREGKGRLKPKDKHLSASWKKRDEARKVKQEAFAAEHAAQVTRAMLSEGE